jgi:uncharacterized protein (DUF302 family)
MLATVLALVLVVMALRRIHKEGLTISDQPKQQHFKRSVEEVQRQQREEQAVINMSDDSGSESVVQTKHGFGKKVGMSVDEAVKRLSKLLRVEGCQVLSDTDITAVLRKQGMPEYQMLTTYHGELASRAIDMDPSIGLLASNVIVRRDLSDVVHVEFFDPSLLPGSSSHSDLHEMASDLRAKLLRVLQSV